MKKFCVKQDPIRHKPIVRNIGSSPQAGSLQVFGDMDNTQDFSGMGGTPDECPQKKSKSKMDDA